MSTQQIPATPEAIITTLERLTAEQATRAEVTAIESLRRDVSSLDDKVEQLSKDVNGLGGLYRELREVVLGKEPLREDGILRNIESIMAEIKSIHALHEGQARLLRRVSPFLFALCVRVVLGLSNDQIAALVRSIFAK